MNAEYRGASKKCMQQTISILKNSKKPINYDKNSIVNYFISIMHRNS